MSDYEDIESFSEEFDYGSGPYMFEPEYTDYELRELEEVRAGSEQADADGDKSVDGTTHRKEDQDVNWCRYGKNALEWH